MHLEFFFVTFAVLCFWVLGRMKAMPRRTVRKVRFIVCDRAGDNACVLYTNSSVNKKNLFMKETPSGGKSLPLGRIYFT